jgi:DNA end-binding protein Ku
MKELLKRKQHGEKIEVPKERAPSKVVNLMEALRQSIAAGGGARGKPPVRSVQHRTGGKKKAARSSARQRKAG